jgi:phosphoglycolate phosphatase-like HAD superfamily hydrolase
VIFRQKNCDLDHWLLVIGWWLFTNDKGRMTECAIFFQKTPYPLSSTFRYTVELQQVLIDRVIMPTMPTMPTILALDFDGVVCDGLIEYFQTAWRAYCQIWLPENTTPPEGLAEQFYRLRPVIETGWEMPVLLRSLLLNAPEDEILENWQAIAQQRITADQLNPGEIADSVDRVRDEWIASDPEDWLAQHRFYPGIIPLLQRTLKSAIHLVIVTTKEGRFVHQLLQQQGINLPTAQIYGKEVKQPKSQTLRALHEQFSNRSGQPVFVWFVEDRLKTLQTIQNQPDLSYVKLYLADWGYNTAKERAIADQDPQIWLLSLKAVEQEFLVFS